MKRQSPLRMTLHTFILLESGFKLYKDLLGLAVEIHVAVYLLLSLEVINVLDKYLFLFV